MASARLTLFWLLALPVLVFTGFFLIPLGVVLVSSFTDPEAGLTLAHYARILLDAYHWQVIATTFRIAIFSTLICVALGYPLACIWCGSCRCGVGGAPASSSSFCRSSPRTSSAPSAGWCFWAAAGS